MPFLTSKALESDIEGLSFLRAVLQPIRQPAAISHPKLPSSASDAGRRPATSSAKRELVASS
jgi:hypothetical protein